MEENMEIDKKELIKQMAEEAKENGDDYVHLQIFIPKPSENGKEITSTPITILEGRSGAKLLYVLLKTMAHISEELENEHPEVMAKLMLDRLEELNQMLGSSEEPHTKIIDHKEENKND